MSLTIADCRLCTGGTQKVEHGEYGYSVRCSCGVFSGHCKYERDAVNAWNKDMLRGEPVETISLTNEKNDSITPVGYLSGTKVDWPRKVDDTLKERGNRYGEFSEHALIAQGLKSLMYDNSGWQKLNDYQREALEMIQHKVARILNGDPNYIDNWHDIAGYSSLVEKELAKINS